MVIQTGQPFLLLFNYGYKTYYDLPQKYFMFNITLHQFQYKGGRIKQKFRVKVLCPTFYLIADWPREGQETQMMVECWELSAAGFKEYAFKNA